MKHALAILTLGCAFTHGLLAGVPVASDCATCDPKDSKKITVPPCDRTWFPEAPVGLVTIGGSFSNHLSGVYLDAITGLWAPCERDAFLFLNSRYSYEDNGQFVSSTGLGFRKLLPGRDVILGVNAYYDGIHSDRANDFAQFGVGAEILTRWVDARFNYYLPEGDRYEVDRLEQRETARFGGMGPGGMTAVTQERNRTFRRYEAALEGFNAEVGFLIPGLDKYTEVRIFGGYHHYNNPFGSDFEGFQGRVEARLLPGVIADVAYWESAALMGGHWTAGVRVSVPFSTYELVHGRNPFAGAADQFRPRQREFKERMNDMVIRSHRIKTVTSNRELTDDHLSTETRVLGPGQVLPPGGLGVPLE